MGAIVNPRDTLEFKRTIEELYDDLVVKIVNMTKKLRTIKMDKGSAKKLVI